MTLRIRPRGSIPIHKELNHIPKGMWFNGRSSSLGEASAYLKNSYGDAVCSRVVELYGNMVSTLTEDRVLRSVDTVDVSLHVQGYTKGTACSQFITYGTVRVRPCCTEYKFYLAVSDKWHEVELIQC